MSRASRRGAFDEGAPVPAEMLPAESESAEALETPFQVSADDDAVVSFAGETRPDIGGQLTVRMLTHQHEHAGRTCRHGECITVSADAAAALIAAGLAEQA